MIRKEYIHNDIFEFEAGGSISGLKAIGDFEVAVSWKQGKAEKAEIKNNQGQPCMVKCDGLDKAQITVGGKPAKVTPMGNGVYSIKSKAGDTIAIVFAS